MAILLGTLSRASSKYVEKPCLWASLFPVTPVLVAPLLPPQIKSDYLPCTEGSAQVSIGGLRTQERCTAILRPYPFVANDEVPQNAGQPSQQRSPIMSLSRSTCCDTAASSNPTSSIGLQFSVKGSVKSSDEDVVGARSGENLHKKGRRSPLPPADLQLRRIVSNHRPARRSP